MKKRQYQLLMPLLGLVFTTSSPSLLAGLKGVRSTGSSVSGNSSGATGPEVDIHIISPKPTIEKVNIKEGVARASCKQDPLESTYFPLDFFQQISRDGRQLEFEIRENNKIMVKFPPSVDACGKFVPQLVQDPQTKNMTIMIKEEKGTKYGDYLKCLEDKKMTDGTNILHDTISGGNYSEYSYVLDYDFDKNADITKTVKVSFGFPTAFQGKDGYNPAYGFEDGAELPSSMCMKTEKVAPTSLMVNKGRDLILQELSKICQEGNAQRIAEARRSIGNADALKGLVEELQNNLDAGYLIAVKKDVDNIFSEMGKIEERISKEGKTLDESTSKKIMSKYAELAKDLDSKFLNPAIFRLDNLMKKRADMNEGEARDKIDEEIAKLNDDIGAFAKPGHLTAVYGLMEKYALLDQEKTIEDIRLKSFLYSKVFPSSGRNDKRGKALSFVDANKRQVAGMQNNSVLLAQWLDVYNAGTGDKAPIARTENERKSLIENMNNRWVKYKQQEQTQYQEKCGVGWTGSVKDPLGCQALQQGMKQREEYQLQLRSRDLKTIQAIDTRLGKMAVGYNQYLKQEAQAKIDESFNMGPVGAASASGADPAFENQFPQYNPPTGGTTPLDTWAYNPQNPAMGMMPQQQFQQSQFQQQGVYGVQPPGQLYPTPMMR